MILDCSTSLTSISGFTVAQILCLLQKSQTVSQSLANQRDWKIDTLWPTKFFPKVWTNLFCLTCEFLEGKTILSNHQNNIRVSSTEDDIILDCQIKTHGGWVTKIEFLWETINYMTRSATATCKKKYQHLHVELGHPSKFVTCTTAKALGIQVSGTFK